MVEGMSNNQFKCEGCISIKYFKRFYTIDGVGACVSVSVDVMD